MSETPEKRPVGRPSDYRDEYVQQMLDYFNPETHTSVKVDKEGKASISPLPLLSGFAWKLGVTRQTLHNWAHERDEAGNYIRPDFFDAYTRCRDAQEVILASGGLMGLYNASFAGLTAKNILGWRDKQDLEHSGPGGTPMVFKITQDEADL